MNSADVLIVGSGIVGTAVAHRLSQAGLRITVVEKGPAYPYPHAAQYGEQVVALYDNPAYYLPNDLKGITVAGNYRGTLERERFMWTGGTATRWGATTPRMVPSDFKTQSLFGFGIDWPLDYDALEPYYCQAERFLGVSGREDNPFAGPRSKPFPLPHFGLSYGDRILEERLESGGFTLHTTPQARTRTSFENRPACQNYGTCRFCPIGARYSPNYHLDDLVAAGEVRLLTETSVRRIYPTPGGDTASVVCQRSDDLDSFEIGAKTVVVAAGAIESARLLLQSKNSAHPEGLGNASSMVGRNLTFHIEWSGMLELDEPLFAGRVGAATAQTAQFMSPDTRGRHGGILISFHNDGQLSRLNRRYQLEETRFGHEIVERMSSMPRLQPLTILSESAPDERKSVSLSSRVDRFGDGFAHVDYETNAFDHETYLFASRLFDRMRDATRARSATMAGEAHYGSGAHHMGTCSMGDDPATSVVDSFGRVHGTRNVFIAGGATFPGGNGAANPTLTMVALALRTADYMLDRR